MPCPAVTRQVSIQSVSGLRPLDWISMQLALMKHLFSHTVSRSVSSQNESVRLLPQLASLASEMAQVPLPEVPPAPPWPPEPVVPPPLVPAAPVALEPEHSFGHAVVAQAR